MNQHQENHRPPLKTPLRRASSTSASWRTLLVMAIVVACYAAAQYATERGDAKALRAENAKLKERLRVITECKSSFYHYPNIPQAPLPRSERKRLQ